MKHTIKLEPYISSVDFTKSKDGEIMCRLGNWSVNVQHNYKGKDVELKVSPRFKLRDILNNTDISLEKIILDNNADQFLRYFKIKEKEEFSDLNKFFDRFKKEVQQRINENDIRLFINCYKEFLKSTHHFKEDDCYMINKHGEMEKFNYNRDNNRFVLSYRFPDLHYNKKITKFTYSGTYEIEDIEHFSNGTFTNESVVTNILKSRKVPSYHVFIPQNKDDWEKTIKTLDELLDNKKGEEILFFKREDDLNISLDLEMTSPKIILTDFFKENIGEYVFQLYTNPKFCQEKDIDILNRIIITDNMIKDIKEAFKMHDVEMKAFKNK